MPVEYNKSINAMTPGDEVEGYYILKSANPKVAANGKPFLTGALSDRTGTMELKVWDYAGPLTAADEGTVVKVRGTVGEYRGTPQFTAGRIRPAAQEDPVDVSALVPTAPIDCGAAMEDLRRAAASITDPDYRAMAEAMLEAHGETLASIPAAKSVHHGFVGGLLEHTLGVTKNCDYFAKMYPVLNRDLLLTAAIFHDIGKLKELSTFPENDYTDAGQLLGHIMIGAEWVGDAIKSIDGFPVVLANELKHCILAHHGELEFGSPKKPALVEALALSFADNIDAKMETFRELLVNVPENDTKWQGYNRFMETNFRRTSV